MADPRQTNSQTDFDRGGGVDDPALEGELHSGGDRTRAVEHAEQKAFQGPKTMKKNRDIVRGRSRGGTF